VGHGWFRPQSTGDTGEGQACNLAIVNETAPFPIHRFGVLEDSAFRKEELLDIAMVNTEVPNDLVANNTIVEEDGVHVGMNGG